jgi:hypothetical protein
MAYMRRNALTMGLFVPAIADNWEIFINGNLIAREFYLDDEGKISVHKNKQMFSIPFDKSYLNEGRNTMIIRVVAEEGYQDTGLYYTSGYYIDNYAFMSSQFSSYLLVIVSGIYFFIVFYTLLIFFRSPREK